MRHRLTLPLRVAASLLLLAQMGIAPADGDHDEARQLRKSGDILSLEVILERLRPRYSGRILEVELERRSGQLIYELEILGKDGVVHKLYVDAKTGDMLRSKVDD